MFKKFTIIILIVSICLLFFIYYKCLTHEQFIVESNNNNETKFVYNKDIHEPNKLSLCESKVQCVTYKNKGLQVIKENKPYLFIHIPKNAGTYIRKIMPGMNGGHDHASIYEIKQKLPELYNNMFTFAILRNPWERCEY